VPCHDGAPLINSSGFTNPNWRMLAAIFWICFCECVRALRGAGFSPAIGRYSIASESRSVQRSVGSLLSVVGTLLACGGAALEGSMSHADGDERVSSPGTPLGSDPRCGWRAVSSSYRSMAKRAASHASPSSLAREATGELRLP
jgi:hypothetical protein